MSGLTENGTSEQEQVPGQAVGWLQALKDFGGKLSLSRGNSKAPEAAVDLASLPKGDYRDVDARRAAAREKLGRELADFAEFF